MGTVPITGRTPAAPTRRKGTSGMTDFDRLYERVDKTSDNLDRLTVQVTEITAGLRNHDDRLKIIEERPAQSQSSLRGWLGILVPVCICLFTIIVSAVGNVMTGAVGILISLLLTYLSTGKP